jgi:hypothetical protein
LFPARKVRGKAFVLSFAILVTAPALCSAQDPAQPSREVIQQRYDDLVVWLADYKQWEEWILKWGNRVAFNAAGGIIKDRPARPDPPAWLAADCEASLSSEGALAEACQILARWDGISQLILQRKHLGGSIAAPTDVVRKTSFLHRIHLSGGWVPAQLPAPQVYLVVGMQVGVVEVGRATLPAVGVGLMTIADGTGGYEWKPATVIGIGYRLVSFGFPGINREANLHLNVARATIHGSSTLPVGFDPSQTLVGFSLTFAKR